MIKPSDQAAFPTGDSAAAGYESEPGLTKRELFAAMILAHQGPNLGSPHYGDEIENRQMALKAVDQADALIWALGAVANVPTPPASKETKSD